MILDDVETYLARFVAYPDEASRVATVLWVAHTHLLTAFETTPRLAYLSPEPGSGKSRALEMLEMLCPRPLLTVNVSPAYLFRKVADEAGPPTILYDEIDTVFGPRAKDNEDIRGMLNAGYRRGATAGRCVVRGKTVEVEELPAFAAVALAGLGDLPDTILSRSIVVKMRRRAPDEIVEPYRRRVHAPIGEGLRDELGRWAESVWHLVEDAWPDLPAGVEDRAADCWEPLLAVADAAGGDWPDRARVTAVTHVTHAREAEGSLGVRLLTDLRDIFGNKQSMSTLDILTALYDLDESPWSDLRGKPLDARGLARRLKQYGVQRGTVRIGEQVVKGYRAEDLHDPWRRYLPAPSQESVTSVTEVTPHPVVPAQRHHESVTSVTSVTDDGLDYEDEPEVDEAWFA